LAAIQDFEVLEMVSADGFIECAANVISPIIIPPQGDSNKPGAYFNAFHWEPTTQECK
jgi:hypothetical protein